MMASTITSTTTNQQRAAILKHLKYHGTLTTLEARDTLDIMHPAARVMELRGQGHKIETVWSNDLSNIGTKHRCARYILDRAGEVSL